MKTILKLLFIAVASITVNYSFGQQAGKTHKKKQEKTHQTTKQKPSKASSRLNRMNPKDKPSNAAVDQKSIPKKAGNSK